ncbi:hypothetical protein [Sphingomonas ginkgonis]|nr:hypothetical protein [Sphingomonas ginkgonis]
MKKVGLGLGVFSIGLGALEVTAPGWIAKKLGLEGSKTAETTTRIFGARELLAGAMLLRGPAVSTNAWNRVIGDTVDAGALLLALRSSTKKGAVAGALAFVAGAAALDWWAAQGLDQETGRTFPVIVDREPVGG